MSIENNRKRKAEEQLSPYSSDPINPQPIISVNCEETNEKPGFKTVKLRRNNPHEIRNKEALKGIFGKVSFTSIGSESVNAEKKDLVAGLNKSFLKAVQKVIEKQSNRNLGYLLKQYKDFMEEINRNNKEL